MTVVLLGQCLALFPGPRLAKRGSKARQCLVVPALWVQATEAVVSLPPLLVQAPPTDLGRHVFALPPIWPVPPSPPEGQGLRVKGQGSITYNCFYDRGRL